MKLRLVVLLTLVLLGVSGTALLASAPAEGLQGDNAAPFDMSWPAHGELSSTPSGTCQSGASHDGYDINDLVSDPGPPVYAAATGVVSFSGTGGGNYGALVTIAHGQSGYETRYAHLASRSVSANDWVVRGQQVGVMGNDCPVTACGVHLHFEVDRDGAEVDFGIACDADTSPNDAIPHRVEFLSTATPVTFGDFNNDGRSDIAVGSPGEAVGGASAGVVNVLYGTSSGLSATGDQLLYQGATISGHAIQGGAEAGDGFGHALATGDFDGDAYDDLAIGAPGETIGTQEDAGVVHILFGSSGGLTGDQNDMIYQGLSGYLGAYETGDYFGFSVAAGNVDTGASSDLAVGVPGENDASLSDTGGVQVFNGASTDDYWFDQDSANVEGGNEEGDSYGFTVALKDVGESVQDDLLIGVPLEDIGSVADAGASAVIYGSSSGISASTYADDLVYQGAASILGTAEAGDWFGWSVDAGDVDDAVRDDLVVGVPGEDSKAGALQVFLGGLSGLTTTDAVWDQDSTGVQDSAESKDYFGWSVRSARLSGNDFYDDVLVGIPGENFSGNDEGAAQVLRGSLTGVSGADEFWHQDVSSEVKGTEESNDWFGFSSATALINNDTNYDAGIGAPEDAYSGVPGGAVAVLYGDSDSLQATSPEDDLWTQGTSGVDGTAEELDFFG